MDVDLALHSSFEGHFRHPLYRDDEDDLAPFGSDDGADALRTWALRRAELGPSTTLRWMLSEDFGDVGNVLQTLRGADPPQVDVEAIIIGTGFALLALTGRLDSEGKTLVVESLDRTAAFYADGFGSYRDQMVGDLKTYETYEADSDRPPAALANSLVADRARLIAARPSWVSIDTHLDNNRGSKDVVSRRQFVRQHRAGYNQKMVWLQDQINGGRVGHPLVVTAWSQWWDQQDKFIGVYVSVDYKTDTAPVFRFRTNRASDGAVYLMVSAVLDLDGITDDMATSPNGTANRHLIEILEAIGTRCHLGPCPQLPKTKKEQQAEA